MKMPCYTIIKHKKSDFSQTMRAQLHLQCQTYFRLSLQSNLGQRKVIMEQISVKCQVYCKCGWALKEPQQTGDLECCGCLCGAGGGGCWMVCYMHPSTEAFLVWHKTKNVCHLSHLLSLFPLPFSKISVHSLSHVPDRISLFFLPFLKISVRSLSHVPGSTGMSLFPLPSQSVPPSIFENFRPQSVPHARPYQSLPPSILENFSPQCVPCSQQPTQVCPKLPSTKSFLKMERTEQLS